MLGIIIGVAAVIIIMAVGAGAQSLIIDQVASLGTNIIGVLPGGSDEQGPPSQAFGIVITTLTYEDALALKEKTNVPDIVDVVPYVKSLDTVTWKDNSYTTNISGTTGGYLTVEGGEVAQGRFITGDESVNMAKIIVLGSTVKKNLFGDSDAIGQRVKIKNHIFDVVGVMKDRGTVAFQNYDDQVFIPLKTMQKLIAGVNHLGFLRAKVDKEENVAKAIEDVKITLRERHDIEDQSGAADDFSVRSANEALDIIKSVTDALRYFLAAMAALSLIVGGIGIMNIMLIGVNERTREIGLRKAVGATNVSIMGQFLVEAITITVFGGIIGIIIGVLFSYLIAVTAHFLKYSWRFEVSILSIIMAVGVSATVGLIFGLYPASKASKLNPIEALRYE